jgi:signal transduction histidine kinase
MAQLVDDLLDVSRISHGRLRLQRERIDLRAVVSNAIETLESDIKERHHQLAIALPDAPVWLQADVAPGAGVREPAGQCIQIHGCGW